LKKEEQYEYISSDNEDVEEERPKPYKTPSKI
jgi:hypothetical protein